MLAEEALQIPLSIGVFDGDKMVAYSAVIDLNKSGGRVGEEEKICWPNVVHIYHELEEKFEPALRDHLQHGKVALIHAIYTNQ